MTEPTWPYGNYGAPYAVICGQKGSGVSHTGTQTLATQPIRTCAAMPHSDAMGADSFRFIP